jgi:hypothetical protein
MRIFVSEPSYQSTCIWSAHYNPRLICYSVHIIGFYSLDKIGSIF